MAACHARNGHIRWGTRDSEVKRTQWPLLIARALLSSSRAHYSAHHARDDCFSRARWALKHERDEPSSRVRFNAHRVRDKRWSLARWALSRARPAEFVNGFLSPFSQIFRATWWAYKICLPINVLFYLIYLKWDKQTVIVILSNTSCAIFYLPI